MSIWLRLRPKRIAELWYHRADGFCLGSHRARPISCLSALLPVLLLVGCEARTDLVEPAGADGDTTPGQFQLATLTLTVRIEPEDSAVARALGFDGGVLPGVEVTIERQATAGSKATSVTDVDGVARFEELVPGDYNVSVFHPLTPQEIETLVAEGEEITSFAGSGVVEVTAPATATSVDVRGDRESSSLVISEVSITNPRLPSGNHYRLGHYLEVYNNTDTTIFLDGKVVSVGLIWVFDANETFNCENMRAWREDPGGIWTWRVVEAFPGPGGDHPLEPGRSAVIATDAIDHSQVFPGLPDLSSADFEFIGSSDVDNPDVPNMVSLGKKFADEAFGHGLFFSLTDETVLIAEAVDVSELPKDDVPGAAGNPEHWRIPASRILDVAALGPTPAIERDLTESGLGSPCDQFTHEDFARGWAPLVDSSVLDGHHRPVIRIVDGRKILQRTRVSALDFFSGPMSPGSIPD